MNQAQRPTQVMAGPSGSVTVSYISRSFCLTSGVMDMPKGYPSNTVSACLTSVPVKYKIQLKTAFIQQSNC